jgi:hypothetical protein
MRASSGRGFRRVGRVRYVRRPLNMFERRVSLATAPGSMTARDGGPLCDFCGNERPVFAYAADRTSLGEPVEPGVWRWGACSLCADAIEVGRWAWLQKRTFTYIKQLPPFYGRQEYDHELLRDVRDLYNDFRAHVLSEKREP